MPPDGRQLAGFEIGMPFQNPQRIATRNRCVLAGVAGENHAGVTRQVKQPFHVVNANRPSLIQHHQLTGRQHRFRQQQALQRLRLESFFSQHFGCRRRWRAEQRFYAGLLASGDQFAQRRSFACASQPPQAGDAVTGAQHMINGSLLIFAEPGGRAIAGMQGRNRIASRVDGLNQIQFRRQNFFGRKPAFGLYQFRRILHLLFQIAQIHLTLPVRQSGRQQFMLRDNRFTLEHMGDGMIQGLFFQSGDVRLTSALHRRRKFLQCL